MVVTFHNNRFECTCAFEERLVPKQNGFKWDTDRKKWYAVDVAVAARLRKHFDPVATNEIERTELKSKPWTGLLSYPKGLTPYNFQLDAVRFALSRNRSYLGMDAGLGKTIVAAIMHDTLKEFTVYICPPFLVENTKEEFKKWSPRLHENVLVVADSRVAKPATKKEILDVIAWGRDKKVPVNLIVDEAHRFKNSDAHRTRAVFGLTHLFSRVTFMSGTPMPNRPIELFPVLDRLAPETIDYMTKFQYGEKYCQLHQNQFGWDFTGASNVKDLAARVIGTFMLRMKKMDVLKELPPKIEEVVILSDDMPAKVGAVDHKLLKMYSPEDLMKHSLSIRINDGDPLHLMTYRRELGLAKVPSAAKYIKGLLEDSDESILIFAIHKDTIAKLAEELHAFSPFVITGDTPMTKRHEYVKDFQGAPLRRVFIGNIQSCGTGFTLTKATRVVFVEYSWVPGDNSQASDRVHRIGQTEPVLCQYLVFKNSCDRAVLETLLSKQKTIDHI